jgi:hypothetical protein
MKRACPALFEDIDTRRILDMKFQADELEFLSAWAREEKAVDPYALPAHQLQAANKIPSVTLIRAIKAWARLENRRDEDIFNVCANANPSWPWSSADRLAEIASPTQDARKAS